MTEIPDDEVEAAARAVERLVKPFAVAPAPYSGSIGWGATPADIARAALAAVRPRWEKQLAELQAEARQADIRAAEADADVIGNIQIAQRLAAERDAARAGLERVRIDIAERIMALMPKRRRWLGAHDPGILARAWLDEAARVALDGLPEQPKGQR